MNSDINNDCFSSKVHRPRALRQGVLFYVLALVFIVATFYIMNFAALLYEIMTNGCTNEVYLILSDDRGAKVQISRSDCGATTPETHRVSVFPSGAADFKRILSVETDPSRHQRLRLAVISESLLLVIVPECLTASSTERISLSDATAHFMCVPNLDGQHLEDLSVIVTTL